MNELPVDFWGKVLKALLGEFLTWPGVMNSSSIIVLVRVYKSHRGQAIQELKDAAMSFPGFTVTQDIAIEFLRREWWVNTALIGAIVICLAGSFVIVYRYVEKHGTPLLDYVMESLLSQKELVSNK